MAYIKTTLPKMTDTVYIDNLTQYIEEMNKNKVNIRTISKTFKDRRGVPFVFVSRSLTKSEQLEYNLNKGALK
jgi:hypothetical protein